MVGVNSADGLRLDLAVKDSRSDFLCALDAVLDGLWQSKNLCKAYRFVFSESRTQYYEPRLWEDMVVLCERVYAPWLLHDLRNYDPKTCSLISVKRNSETNSTYRCVSVDDVKHAFANNLLVSYDAYKTFLRTIQRDDMHNPDAVAFANFGWDYHVIVNNQDFLDASKVLFIPNWANKLSLDPVQNIVLAYIYDITVDGGSVCNDDYSYILDWFSDKTEADIGKAVEQLAERNLVTVVERGDRTAYIAHKTEINRKLGEG